jgi:hypothetical protein
MGGKVKGLFRRKIQVLFICPVTLSHGASYTIWVDRVWWQKVKPAIKLSLVILKLTLAVVGIPCPLSLAGLFPALVETVTSELLTTTLIGEIDSLEKEFEDDDTMCSQRHLQASDAGETLNQAEREGLLEADFLGFFLQGHTISDEAMDRIKKAMIEDHEIIYSLLYNELEPPRDKTYQNWKPKRTGLVHITSDCDKSTHWVLNHPNVIAKFHAEGKACFKISIY